MTANDKHEYISATKLLVLALGCSIVLGSIVGKSCKYWFSSDCCPMVDTNQQSSATVQDHGAPYVRGKIDKSQRSTTMPATAGDQFTRANYVLYSKDRSLVSILE